MSKTKSSILFSHSAIFDPLFADDNVKKWRENVYTAMQEYSDQQLSDYKEKMKAELDTANLLIVALRKYINSVSGRDLTYDRKAFEEVDKLSNKYFEIVNASQSKQL